MRIHWSVLVLAGVVVATLGALCVADKVPPIVVLPVLTGLLGWLFPSPLRNPPSDPPAVPPAVVALVAVGLLSLAPAACSALPSPEPRAAMFGVELQACVAHSRDITEYRECRAEVRARYSLEADGGSDGQ